MTNEQYALFAELAKKIGDVVVDQELLISITAIADVLGHLAEQMLALTPPEKRNEVLQSIFNLVLQRILREAEAITK